MRATSLTIQIVRYDSEAGFTMPAPMHQGCPTGWHRSPDGVWQQTTNGVVMGPAKRPVTA